MDLQLNGKNVLVLGSSSGLGFAIAKAYSDEGAKTAIVSRSIGRAEKASKMIKNSTAFQCDLTLPSAGINIVEEVTSKLGSIDILVTNTGGPPKGKFMDLNQEDWLKGYNSLWMSAIDSIKAVIPQMRERKWGRIILSTSLSSKQPVFNLTISNAYRSGLIGVMKTVSNEVAEFGITVNAILPGYTKTERLAELNIPDHILSEDIPAKRVGRPEEFAALAVFLGSEQAAYITGQSIACDGGTIRGY